MQAQVVLTVSEGKRLIAKGIAASDVVRSAMKNGIVAVAKGTTNSYVVEELLGKKIAKTDYVTGKTFPSNLPGEIRSRVGNRMSDVVFRNGELLDGASVPETIKEMKRGDIVMKGANAINYATGTAGVLIGDQSGGTVGAIIGYVTARRINLIVPVGLEKEVPVDLEEAALTAGDPDEDKYVNAPTLWTFQADLFTEVEALEVLSGADIVPIAAGGIGGAEGAFRLLISGDKADVEKALSVVDEVQGEPPFLPG